MTISHRRLVARTISRKPISRRTISRGNVFTVVTQNEFRFVAETIILSGTSLDSSPRLLNDRFVVVGNEFPFVAETIKLLTVVNISIATIVVWIIVKLRYA